MVRGPNNDTESSEKNPSEFYIFLVENKIAKENQQQHEALQ